MARFVVEMIFGDDLGKRQRLRPAHREYWQSLSGRGILIGGGLWSDDSGGLLLCQAADERQLWDLLNGDPFVQAGVAQVRLREWQVMMGEALMATPQPFLSAGPTPPSPPSGSSSSGGPVSHSVASEPPSTTRSVATSCSSDQLSASDTVTDLRVTGPDMGQSAAVSQDPDDRIRLEGALTPHQMRIVALVLDGRTNREIAGALKVSRRAIELHLTSIYRKLGIARRAQLAFAVHREPVGA